MTELHEFFRREADRTKDICRTAGAEGRFFVILCASAAARRLFEQRVAHDSSIELELLKIPAGPPVPTALREHSGDHFNRRLYCVDFVAEAVDAQGEGWFEQLEAHRQEFIKKGTWVLLWLTRPRHLRLLEERAPQTWASRRRALVLHTPELLIPDGQETGSPSDLEHQAASRLDQGALAEAMARYAEVVRSGRDGGESQLGLARLLTQLGQLEDAEPLFQSLLSGEQDVESGLLEIRARQGLVELAYRRGRTEEKARQEQLFREALDGLKAPALRARALALRITGEQGLDGQEPALTVYEQSAESARGADEPRLLAERLLAWAGACRRAGDLETARQALGEAQQTQARPLEVVLERGRVSVAQAVLADQAGDEAQRTAGFDDAQKVFADAYNLARAAGDTSGMAETAMELADMNFRAAAPEAALTALDMAVELYVEARLSGRLSEVLRARRLVHALLGQMGDALADLNQLVQLADVSGFPEWQARADEERGDHQVDLKLPRGAAVYWKEALALYDQLGLQADSARCRSKLEASNRS